MNKEVRKLEPQIVWNNFADLNAVPRPSKKEEKVIAFIRQFAERFNLKYDVDKVGNMVLRKPATKGMENKRPVILQAHLDMVHQKNADTDFDFDTQGISMQIEGEWVTAQGTTLGADNGMGVAAAMSVLESKEVAHPELEVLFTIDEEAGMTGVHNLQPGFLQGEILINLDTEDDDELSVGCAGGVDTTVEWSYPETFAAENSMGIELMVKGLKGGHSGMDIIFGRGNANKIMNRMLRKVAQDYGAQLHSIDGGGLRNAIPRESKAILAVSREAWPQLQKHWQELSAQLQDEFATTDPGLQITFAETQTPEKVMEQEAQQQLVWALQCCHDGIRRLSPDVDNLVETSNNLARVQVGAGQGLFLNLQRSDRESAKWDIAHSIAAPFELIGAKVEQGGSYPGWKLDPQAPMLGMMKDLYEELFNESPKVIACHAGLECGLISEHYPNLEMISFGPTIQHPHSPDERVHIGSVAKFWNYLQAALQRIPEKKKAAVSQ